MTLLSRRWSGVRSTTEAPKQRRVAEQPLSDLRDDGISRPANVAEVLALGCVV